MLKLKKRKLAHDFIIAKNLFCHYNKLKYKFNHESIRELYKYRQWRSDIFTRDDFTCVVCYERGCTIQADHFPDTFIKIIERNNIDTLEKAIDCEELWNINNGRTMCINCHKKTDTWGRRKFK